MTKYVPAGLIDFRTAIAVCGQTTFMLKTGHSEIEPLLEKLAPFVEKGIASWPLLTSKELAKAWAEVEGISFDEALNDLKAASAHLASIAEARRLLRHILSSEAVKASLYLADGSLFTLDGAPFRTDAFFETCRTGRLAHSQVSGSGDVLIPHAELSAAKQKVDPDTDLPWQDYDERYYEPTPSVLAAKGPAEMASLPGYLRYMALLVAKDPTLVEAKKAAVIAEIKQNWPSWLPPQTQKEVTYMATFMRLPEKKGTSSQ